MPRLGKNCYGKSAIRLVKVGREGAAGTEEAGRGPHSLSDLTVDVRLEGEFTAAHVQGDNRDVLPTDTMKNVVYALARERPVEPPEAFGIALGNHLLESAPAAAAAVVALRVHSWTRADAGAGPCEHTFVRGSAERRVATVMVDRRRISVSAGIEGLSVLKTSGSAFAGFLRDRHTTLPETRDRIFASEIEASWRYSAEPASWTETWRAVRHALIATFADHQSESVQHTLFAMGTAALDVEPLVEEIQLVLPNQHHLLVDLSAFGLENPNEIFVATREPFGRIEAVVTRE